MAKETDDNSPRDENTDWPSEAPPGERSVPVIGIAASDGGGNALSRLLQGLKGNFDCAFVIAQNVSPTQKSMLAELLGRETRLPVQELERRSKVSPGVIYVAPPGFDVVYRDGSFRLVKPTGHSASHRPSADRLFISLADELGERAVGVVLSGTGGDGSYGIRAIREKGGITIAQDPQTCTYSAMPEAAIRTGCVDLMLAPKQIGEHIQHILEKPRDLNKLQEISGDNTRNRDLFDILLGQTMVDLRQYNESTLNRRILRRMSAKGIEDFEEYIQLCRSSQQEVEALYRDLLISVTRFFRDFDQFQVLADTLSDMVANRTAPGPLRIWISGCATGEEAYSIAMLACEAMGGLTKVEPDDLQIFATDIDENALNVARKGVYPVAAGADIPPDLLKSYFEMQSDHIVVRHRLRGFIIFSRHNIFQDAPFSRIDLVSIRNVLIYFNNVLQERVLKRVLFALRTNGLLFLGTSEALGAMDGSFVPVAPTIRLFRRRDHGTAGKTAAPEPHRMRLIDGHLSSGGQRTLQNGKREQDEWALFDRLARSVVSDGVLVNRENIIMRVYGDLASYAELTDLNFSSAGLSNLKKPLARDAASLSLLALKYKQMRSGQWHLLEGRNGLVTQVSAYPVGSHENECEDLVLIGFRTEQPTTAVQLSYEFSEYVSHLEAELARTREALQVTIEQLQTSNEELQSVNEELQSANEELLTTNAELINLNEELLVNSSLLERVSIEMNGLIDNLPSITMMVDQGLVIRYASKEAMANFALRERGTGFGHLSQCRQPEGYPALVRICMCVMNDLRGVRETFQRGSSHYELQVEPISDYDNRLVGLVIQVRWVR